MVKLLYILHRIFFNSNFLHSVCHIIREKYHTDITVVYIRIIFFFNKKEKKKDMLGSRTQKHLVGKTLSHVQGPDQQDLLGQEGGLLSQRIPVTAKGSWAFATFYCFSSLPSIAYLFSFLVETSPILL